MADRIGKDEDIGAALIRLARADLDAARAGLAAKGPPGLRVHRARQRLKRVRSLLKVLRPAIGGEVETARARISEAAHLLAGARDADAAAASARELLAASRTNGAGLDRLVASLDREASARHAEIPPMRAVARLIGEADAALAAAPPADIPGEELLERALERAYRRGRRAWRRAKFSLSMPDIHRWRKDVKHLWHLFRLARKRLPASAGRTARRLEILGERLGLDHDHAILAARLVDRPAAPELMAQLALIAEKRRGLERQAFALGSRLYRRDRKKIARRLELN